MSRFVSSPALSRPDLTRALSALPNVLLVLLIGAVIVCGSVLLAPEAGHARSIFLNGVDISNARNQSLEGVDIRIDAEGNVFIIGNHYEIHQQQPLPPLVPQTSLPRTPPPHKPGGKRSSSAIDSPAGHPPLPPRTPPGGVKRSQASGRPVTGG